MAAGDKTPHGTLRWGRFRRRGRDPLGLRQALPGLLLPAVALAMTLLAALALGGAAGAQVLAERWQQGAATAVTVQLPDMDPARSTRALEALRLLPGLVDARPMDQARLAALLRPWLGEVSTLPLPAIVELRFDPLPEDPEALARLILGVVPEAVVETQGVWVTRLVTLAHRLQQAALVAVLLVGLLAVAVVMVGIRAGLAARHEVIAILHDLGATDGDIANRYAKRVALLCGLGALAGLALALPALLWFSALAEPLMGQPPVPRPMESGLAAFSSAFAQLTELPWRMLPWRVLGSLPVVAAVLGWLTGQILVRNWLKRLP